MRFFDPTLKWALILPGFFFSFGMGKDTIPPQGRLVEPAPFSIFSANVIPLFAEANDEQSGIKEVRFFATFFNFVDSNSSETPGFKNTAQIGKAVSPPYQFVWDCSKIPDQDQWRLKFYCDIEDSAGNVFEKAGGEHKGIILDRQPEFSKSVATAQYVTRILEIDGQLKEWDKNAFFSFRNGNNIISACLLWDKINLYIAVQVEDDNLHTPGKDSLFFWWYDCIQIFLDPAFDRTLFRLLDDRQINFGVKGQTHGNVVDFKKNVDRDFTEGYKFKVRYHGTLNNSSDRDTGYVLEAAIPWALIGVAPRNAAKMGFDIFNCDNDHGTRVRVSSGWSGTERYNNNNPSEWGTLLLEDGRSGFSSRLLFGILIPVLAMAGFLVFKVKRRQSAQEPETRSGRSEIITERIIDYLRKNCQRGDLNLNKTAEELKMSADHLRKTFKSVRKKSFSDFLRELRIDMAKARLKKYPLESIGETAYACGFNSPEYFITAFKKSTGGITPSDFRSR